MWCVNVCMKITLTAFECEEYLDFQLDQFTISWINAANTVYITEDKQKTNLNVIRISEVDIGCEYRTSSTAICFVFYCCLWEKFWQILHGPLIAKLWVLKYHYLLVFQVIKRHFFCHSLYLSWIIVSCWIAFAFLTISTFILFCITTFCQHSQP